MRYSVLAYILTSLNASQIPSCITATLRGCQSEQMAATCTQACHWI